MLLFCLNCKLLLSYYELNVDVKQTHHRPIAVNNVHNLFDSASQWSYNNRLKLNFAKTQAINFSLTKAIANLPIMSSF